jgi:hypothetical protein
MDQFGNYLQLLGHDSTDLRTTVIFDINSLAQENVVPPRTAKWAPTPLLPAPPATASQRNSVEHKLAICI